MRVSSALATPPFILLVGFEPFGRERINPSREVARRLDGEIIGGLRVSAVKLPVDYSRAVKAMVAAIRRLRPAAVVALGQAGGRPAISIEQVAINFIDNRATDNSRRRARVSHVVRGGPDAYLSRLPIDAILAALKRRRIPASRSLSAGGFVCNAAMYAILHELRRRRSVPAGFIHLPYDTRQAARHRDAPSMSLELMDRAVRLAISAASAARGQT